MKPKVHPYLDWVELERWFEKKYPEDFKRQVISDWLRGDEHKSNDSLITASGECLDREFDEKDYTDYDWVAVKFFMRVLHREFPDAIDEYGDAKIRYWW